MGTNGVRNTALGVSGTLIAAAIIGSFTFAFAQSERITKLEGEVAKSQAVEQDIKKDVEEIKDDIDQVDKNVVKILIKLGVDPE